ncbi:putative F-actin capping [Dioszegia hungarica]|uniref:F-actin capping n=1 Tax=Dioszegia hungarica TaxID=4972 RepID=A0AA38LXD5_9TREE|nr:putative F-actin capping [Dioszegia hungarica]KAI9637904.1 putative F-actin capping [Dioszegia hungarica]
MAELSSDERAKLGAKLIEQSPPGEVNDVINAIRAIVGDDDALMVHAGPALRAYNLVQLTVVEHPAREGAPAHTSVLSEAAILPGTSGDGERYIDAIGKQSFTFDHVNVVASDYEAYELPEEEEAFRAELAKSLAAYTKNHYPTGQSSVNCSQHPLLPPAPAPEAEPEAAPSPEPATPQPPTDDVIMEGATPAKMAETDDIVTDVIPEQVGAGSSEPAPTPAVGAEVAKTGEVDQPGGLEKVDEAVEEVKQAEDGEAPAENETAGESDSSAESPDGPKETPEVDSTSSDKTSAEKPVERQQERLENPIYTLEVVGNRYKTDAFWTGRWRTCWTVDKAAAKVEGKLLVDVHYFEQGNVQLTTQHKASFAYPSEVSGQSIASQIVTTISKVEAAYQMELQDVYGDLGDKVFRSLRRALPVTRQKVDWEKVGGYSLGSDISKARA